MHPVFSLRPAHDGVNTLQAGYNGSDHGQVHPCIGQLRHSGILVFFLLSLSNQMSCAKRVFVWRACIFLSSFLPITTYEPGLMTQTSVLLGQVNAIVFEKQLHQLG